MKVKYLFLLIFFTVTVFVFLLTTHFCFASDTFASAEIDQENNVFKLLIYSSKNNSLQKSFVLSKNFSKLISYSISTKEELPKIAWIEENGKVQSIYFYSTKPDFSPVQVAKNQNAESILLLENSSNDIFIIIKSLQYLKLINSVDGGKRWSKPKSYFTNLTGENFNGEIFDGKIIINSFFGSSETLEILQPIPPYFIDEKELLEITEDESLSKKLSFFNTDDLQKIYTLQISSRKDFLSTVDITLEENSNITLPKELPFGNYFIRIRAWNGLKNSFSSIKILSYLPKKISNVNPEIKLLKPNDLDWVKPSSTVVIQAVIPIISFKIASNWELYAQINDESIESSLTLDEKNNLVSGIIEIPRNVSHGKNKLKLLFINDNKIQTFETTINIDTKSPEITFNNPQNYIYTNSRNKIPIKVSDIGSGIDQNFNIELSNEGNFIDGWQYYDIATSSLIFLPKQRLDKDIYQTNILLSDKAGNKTSYKNLTVIIDEIAPKITLFQTTTETYEHFYELNGEINKTLVSSITVKNNSKFFRPLIKHNKFSCPIKLERGDNKIEIIVTDLAGNTSTITRNIFLHSPPDNVYFIFDGSYISNGDYVNKNTSLVKIVDENGNGIQSAIVKYDGSQVAYDETTGIVNIGALKEGTHTLSLTAGDKTYSLNFVIDENVKINNILPCPNPFNPDTQSCEITFNASKNCNITAYIYDINGKLLWKQNTLAQIGFNKNLLWDGKDMSGQTLPNGIYLIKISASDPNGNISTAKGRVIILK